jgi:hypothetical protein
VETNEGKMRGAANDAGAGERGASVPANIGARLRSIRGERSQPEFAALLEASEEELERWERGDALLPAWAVFRLAETKGVAPIWLLAGLGAPFDTSGPPADPGRPLRRRSIIPTLLCATFAALQEQLQARGLQLGHEEATNVAMAAYATIDSRESVTSYASLRQLTPQDVRPVVEFVLGLYEKQLPGNAAAPK